MNFRANGAAIANLESHHYYPFGMKMEGIGSSTVTNKYTYNYKELNDDFGLNWHDYGARWYDAALGRWWVVDPLAEPQANYSPYAYTYNNPLSFIDPTGMMGEGADGLTNEQWLDQSRKDGGYWASAKNELKKGLDPQEQTIEDFDGRKHRVGEKDFQRALVTVIVGTRVEINGVVYHQEEEEYVYYSGGSTAWSPLFKSDLVRYARDIGYCTTCTANDIGELFEDIFSNFMANWPPAALSHFRRGDVFRNLSNRNSQPDFTADAYYLRYTMRGFAPEVTVEPITNGTWYEVKAMYGDLYDSKNTYQIRGHINNLAALMAPIRATRPSFMPALYLVTTADVNISPVLTSHAAGMNVNLFHYKAQYRIVNGQYEFKF